MKKLAALVLAGLGTAVALTGCQSHGTDQSRGTGRSHTTIQAAHPAATGGPADRAAVSAPGTPATPPSGGSPTRPAGAGPGTAAAPAAATRPPAGCPVGVDALTAALIGSGDETYSKIPTLDSLQDPECHDGFATVRVLPNGGGQPSRVLFGYDTAGTWRPLNRGSGGFCAGYVPAAVAPQFSSC
jgi:hypothetical protein